MTIIFWQNKKNPISTFLLEWENKSSRKNKSGIIKCSIASSPLPPDYLYFLLLFMQFKKEQNLYRGLIASKQPEANNFSTACYINIFAIKFWILKKTTENATVASEHSAMKLRELIVFGSFNKICLTGNMILQFYRRWTLLKYL